MERSRTLALAHLSVAFLSILPAILLGLWQMVMRSPLRAPLDDPNAYYLSVTAHGSIMAYVFPTFFIMGFGYAIITSALASPLRAEKWAWVGFYLSLTGTIMAVIAVLSGRSSVLYTFYPPLIGSRWYYLGVALVIVGSYFWIAVTIINFRAWKKENPGKPVPLAMFAITACAFLWFWTAMGATAEVLFQLLPVSLGWRHTIDAGLARTLFSITLHAIVYFWLIPAYIGFYTLMPQAAGGRLYSDTMGRITFILFLVFSIPVGMHHLFMDPEHGSGFKFLQAVLTFMVALPTLLTVFTITASLEIAGRARGGKGLLGWIRALPWDEPMVLGTGLSLLILAPGGFGGLVNMSYSMNAMIHNTSWVPAHFHLIFGGTVVIMYFTIAYELWPRLTGRPLVTKRMARLQQWLWFWGMMIMTVPWHIAGLMGQPRRYAMFDYSDPAAAKTASLDVLSVVGGLILALSVLTFFYVIVRSSLAPPSESISPIRYALSVNPPATVPPLLNGFALWNAILILLVFITYGYPIGQFFFLHNQDAPAHSLTRVIGR
ncbi:MAG TPA: cbb3-type cytochrome c oxidase subunit I [Candidatus Sulfotelmatobacter sp.]|nr:cbb3-type cytochrome c oxidase subunit I [Candidatus Sulfotelmatobacter sp.]